MHEVALAAAEPAGHVFTAVVVSAAAAAAATAAAAAGNGDGLGGGQGQSEGARRIRLYAKLGLPAAE